MEELRRSLHLKAIVKVADALRGKVPGIGVLKLPSRPQKSEALLHSAESIRTTAAIYKDVLVEHGLPADFLDQLDAATSALKASVDARGVARSRIVGASTAIAGDLALGRQIVTMIDASLAHALRSDSATLASWRQAKRATVKGARSRAVGSVVPATGTAVSPAVNGNSAASEQVPAALPRVPSPSSTASVSNSAGLPAGSSMQAVATQESVAT